MQDTIEGVGRAKSQPAIGSFWRRYVESDALTGRRGKSGER